MACIAGCGDSHTSSPQAPDARPDVRVSDALVAPRPFGRRVIEGRDPGGGSSTAVTTAADEEDRRGGRYVVQLYCPGPALLTRDQAVDLIEAVDALIQ